MMHEHTPVWPGDGKLYCLVCGQALAPDEVKEEQNVLDLARLAAEMRVSLPDLSDEEALKVAIWAVGHW